MAVAGNCIPSMRVEWRDGALRTPGPIDSTPLEVCFSDRGGGMGSLVDAVTSLMAGNTVRIDARGGQYLELSRMVVERVKHATD